MAKAASREKAKDGLGSSEVAVVEPMVASEQVIYLTDGVQISPFHTSNGLPNSWPVTLDAKYGHAKLE